jgi:hypothetical protein
MTTSNQTSNSELQAETAEANETTPVLAPRGSLPNPKGTSLNVTDSGRIRFGAGLRLLTSK